MGPAALVVGSDERERDSYGRWLRSGGYRVAEAASGADALAQHERRIFPLTVADLPLPDVDGAEFVRSIRAVEPSSKLLMISDGASAAAAVSVMKAGAADILFKPLEPCTLLKTVRQIGAISERRFKNQRLREELGKRYDFSDIVAHSQPMLQALSLAGRVAPLDTTVLITGESGTGKEILARAIHVNSARSHRPLVSINCAAIPEALLESELFGYRRGAFTGAHGEKPGLLTIAHNGTIFFDEVAELPPVTQSKLLRFLQDGSYYEVGGTRPVTVNVRIIAATNAVLQERMRAGTFRADLYYRLSAFPICLRPLRERKEDIVSLAVAFLKTLQGRAGRPVPGLSREATDYLLSQTWPGNVRALHNAIERAVIVSDGDLLTAADFRMPDSDQRSEEGSAERWELPTIGINLPDLNLRLLIDALKRTRGNITAAARLLGLTRPVLRYRIKKYGLSRQLDQFAQVGH
jgi:DNA-binding NtrC family response regulator